MPDPILDAPDPYASIAILLHLSWLRSVGVVSQALAARYPRAEDWEAAMNDPELHEEIAAYAAVVRDIRSLAQVGDAYDLSALQTAGEQHKERAVDSLRLTAERLDIAPDDLLVVLIHA